ncbi:hypothetical protein [Streptomyces tanashiensis]|uniref:Transposase n=1 Tax=Streptomyces tanashiensis TaxID=67367 RepID=A0ABY6R9G0_9ACTN|nr:hypothetical protein [Streptomyces tanashiensis]UZX26242.1 hypothetical protein LDH80_38755 [Streptomyces tanashiensis]GGY33263.1 hypothetical protein GCM10010299_44630 [Streptomyces tanashiensis]
MARQCPADGRWDRILRAVQADADLAGWINVFHGTVTVAAIRLWLRP